MHFNLDLTLIERTLQRQGLHVQSAMVMPTLIREALQQNTYFVMTLEDSAKPSSEASGNDITQETKDRFAVVVALRTVGDATGGASTGIIGEAREKIKKELVGLQIDGFDPIEYERGAPVRFETEKQILLYQMQFTVTRPVTSEVRHYGDC